MKNTINEKLKELFNKTSFEHYEYGNIDNAKELIEKIREEITGEEVNYYSNAMKYLLENDAGLQCSLYLAFQLGYEMKNLNSEILATILQQDKLTEEFSGLEDEIVAIYNV